MNKPKAEFVTEQELTIRYNQQYQQEQKKGEPVRDAETHFALALLYMQCGRFKFVPSKNLYKVPAWSEFHSSKCLT